MVDLCGINAVRHLVTIFRGRSARAPIVLSAYNLFLRRHTAAATLSIYSADHHPASGRMGQGAATQWCALTCLVHSAVQYISAYYCRINRILDSCRTQSECLI